MYDGREKREVVLPEFDSNMLAFDSNLLAFDSNLPAFDSVDTTFDAIADAACDGDMGKINCKQLAWKRPILVTG